MPRTLALISLCTLSIVPVSAAPILLARSPAPEPSGDITAIEPHLFEDVAHGVLASVGALAVAVVAGVGGGDLCKGSDLFPELQGTFLNGHTKCEQHNNARTGTLHV